MQSQLDAHKIMGPEPSNTMQEWDLTVMPSVVIVKLNQVEQLLVNE